MDIEKLKQKIAEVVGVKTSDADLAYHLCVEKISELLDYDEALKIPGLGIFNLKREPLTRQERKNNSGDENQSRQSLIFSPEKDASSTESGSMFITINLDEVSEDSSEFDENIFSLGVDKPLVPVSSTKIDFDSDLAENLEEKVSVLVSQSERIPNFDMWEDYSVVSSDNVSDESDPFSLLDDELKNIMANTEIGDESKSSGEMEEKIEEHGEINLADQLKINEDIKEEDENDNEESAFDDVFKQFEELNLAGDAEEKKEEDSGIEDITFSDDLDLDSFNGPEELDLQDDETEEEEKAKVQKKQSENDEEINWNWGDELKDELESGETIEEGTNDLDENLDNSEDDLSLDTGMFDNLDDTEESEASESINIENELDLSFDEETIPDIDIKEPEEEVASEELEDINNTGELDLNIDDDMEAEELPGTNTVEYTPSDEETVKPSKEISKKFISGVPLYIAIAAFILIGGLSVYFLFFTGTDPVDELPDHAKNEEVDEDTISIQLHTKLEPTDNPVVKTEVESEAIGTDLPNIQENDEENVDPDNNIGHLVDNSKEDEEQKTESVKKEYTVAPNNIPEKHSVKEVPKNPIINTSGLYKKMPNEKRLSNLVFFDGKKYNVQVSSWKTKQQAEAHAKSLIKKGHNAFIVEAYLSSLGGTWYRVRIGDFNSAKEAEEYRKENKL